MQAASGQELEGGPAARGGGGGGEGAADAGDGRAEFREMFVSLVDPAGLLDMEKCGKTAGLMADAASRSGYRAGARMASLLSDIFAGTADLAGRPVADGALGHTVIAFRRMIGVLYDTAASYRGGGDAEPVGELEDAREAVARLRSEADEHRDIRRAAGEPIVRPGGLDGMYVGWTCGAVLRKKQEQVRERERRRGHDPVFPPEPPPIEFPRDGAGPEVSVSAVLDMLRGRPPRKGKDGRG